MHIKILGMGCPKCRQLEANVRGVLEENGIDATVEKVEDMEAIMDYGILGTPGLVLDGKVISAGKVWKPRDLKQLLMEHDG